MAAGTYKSGVAIIVTYQAVACATGKTITMSVYDETHALDAGQSGVMAEIGATGRYYKTFTPNAEGEWIVTITNTTDGGGDVVKAFAVAGHDVDSIGDAVAAITAAGPTKAEMDTGHGLLATVAKQDVIDGYHDVPGEDGAGDTQMRDVIGKKTDTVGGTSIVSISKQVKAKTDIIGASVAPANEYDTQLDQNLSTTEGNIRGADSDTLKTLSDQIDGVGAPAMVG